MTAPTSEVTISLQDLVRFVVRGLVWAALLGGAAAFAVYTYSASQPPVFRAEATLLVTRTTAGFTDFGLTPATAPRLDLSAYRAAAASDRVLADAAQRLDGGQPDASTVRALLRSTDTFIVGDGRDSSLLGIGGQASTPEVAVARANALAEALVEWDRRRATDGLTRVVTTLEQQIEALGEQIRAVQAAGDGTAQAQVDGLIRLRADQQQQLAYARALVASSEGLLSVMQLAGSSIRQIAPRPLVNTAIATLLVILLTYGVLLVRSALNTRLRSVDEVVSVSGLALLAQFPRSNRPKDGWRMQEAAHYLRSKVLFATYAVHPKVLLVTSAAEHEGKTTIACELAEGFARNGYSTLLVDADLRSPSVAEHYQVLGSGATVSTTRDWLAGGSQNGRNVLRVTLEDDAELHVVPQFSSVQDAAEALGRGFPQALDAWSRYDVIIIDSAPVLAVADALAVAPLCSGTLFVFDAQRTPAESIVRSREVLEGVGANVLGAVANRVRHPPRGGAYAGTYGRGYGAPSTRTIRRVIGRSAEFNEPSPSVPSGMQD